MSQKQLADLCGWKSQSRVGNYEVASRAISIDDAITIAKALEVSPSYLIFGDNDGFGVDRHGTITESNPHPVISMNEIPARISNSNIKDIHTLHQWIESDAEIFGSAFWVVSNDESMCTDSGLSIPEGSLVLFDTGRKEKHGNLVLAVMGDKSEPTFKKLVIDGGRRLLKGLNRSWPVIEIDEKTRVIGVAVETKMRLV